MTKKYVVINLQVANNLFTSYDDAERDAKLKTGGDGKNSAAVYGVFELVAMTKVPVPNIEVVKVS